MIEYIKMEKTLSLKHRCNVRYDFNGKIYEVDYAVLIKGIEAAITPKMETA